MFNAIHTLIYSYDPAATRAFLRDVLDWLSVEDPAQAPEWLIFKSGLSEMGVHPTTRHVRGQTYPTHVIIRSR